ncbi:hypothetical protein fugu_005173 [Takifugu bimaculatus]|uniref:Uncharacterized protein n=1 Tax=Takifugu bimaculatus TaxID=433685 RepID=A0A4Z2BAQ0_9TELE|nr:hypothetical protein fugu_005173 [Takifugu bimaculatus]
MKKGPLHFLGRKNQSLFDTNVKMKEMDNVELVLQPSAIPESGTASVRARPTVKHLTSSSLDSFQGFAVPTPKVPLLPPVNGAKINGSVGGDNLLNGSVISTPDHEEELFVPPPPTMAPPPPPGTFIPPPPEFMCGVDDPDLQHLRPPPMPAPKPPSALPSMEEDFSYLKPPQMAPPRPPSICSSGSSTLSASSLPPELVPEHPKFAAPQPPSERQAKMKMPPPKPTRMSSIPTYDSPPQTPAPPPPVQKPTPSTFNPQNTAKLYDIPKASILSRCEDRNPKPKQLVFLEDSRSVKSNPVPAQFDGKTPKLAPPPKPVSEARKERDLNISPGSPSPEPDLKKEIKSESVGPDRPLQTQQTSPQPPKATNILAISSEDQPKGPLSRTGKFSPLLDRKLRNLKGSESGASREASVASPLSLLMAAKERDKHRSNQDSNDLPKNSHLAANVHPSDLLSNSSAAKPRSGLSFSTSQSVTEERSKSAAALENVQTPTTSQKPRPALVKDHTQSSSINGTAGLVSATNLATQQRIPEDDHKDDKEELSVLLLPPPPEFGDTDDMVEPPPDLPPPDPPRQMPQITPPSLKPKPPQAPVLPPLQTKVKPKPPVQTNLTKSPPPPPPPLSPSQATLLSILQKKMLEMDHKMTPVRDGETSPDDWNTPLSDEDNNVPIIPKFTPQSKKNPGVDKAGLDLRELEGKVSSSAVRNGSSSKHQYGCTFTVRPGSKQPITVANKGNS